MTTPPDGSSSESAEQTARQASSLTATTFADMRRKQLAAAVTQSLKSPTLVADKLRIAVELYIRQVLGSVIDESEYCDPIKYWYKCALVSHALLL
jgi:hypothetical protein